MSLNLKYMTTPPKPKRTVAGINANGNKAALIDVLNRLGVCPGELATNLKKLAAHGQSTSEFYKVSVYDVDKALSDVDCSTSAKMQFKASLDYAGLLRPSASRCCRNPDPTITTNDRGDSLRWRS